MLKTINVDQVTIGMFIHGFDGSWMDHPFWKTKFVLKNDKDLSKVKASAVKGVIIDVEKGEDVVPEVEEVIEAEPEPEEETTAPVETPEVVEAVITPEEKPPVQEQARISTQAEHDKAVQTISAAKEAVTDMFHDVRMGKAVDTKALDSLVDDVTASIERNESALISLARLKTKDDYTYMHSVAVCGLMIALAKQLKLSETEIHQAGMAGLMHDIGKARVPLEVLNKPGKLTDEEYALVQKHSRHGYEMLLEAEVDDEVALDVCLHHHEKVSGAGYPEQLKGDEISIFARMGAICDVYDAVTSNRPYKEGWEPAQSLKKMAQWEGHFDENIFKAFVKSLGIYPIGSMVKLDSGQLAVVTDQNPESLLSPVVKCFYSTQSNCRIPPRELNLIKESVNDKIVGLEEPKDWGIEDIETIWCKADAVA